MYYHKDCNIAKKAIIIHSGALGDCVLTLPLAGFLKNTLGIENIQYIGAGDYVSFMPGRTAVNRIRNIHSLRLEKLFTDPSSFEIDEGEPLLQVFEGASWIISFLGESGSDFEANLAYLACCTCSPEIVMLPAKPNAGSNKHISDFYIDELIATKAASIEAFGISEPHKAKGKPVSLICPNVNDINNGLAILTDRAITPTKDNIAIICPGAGGRHKCWHIDNFTAVAKKLRIEGFEPIFLLGNVELERFDEKVIAQLGSVAPVLSSLTIEQVVSLLSVSKVYIGNDSGISHISGAMELPTVSIFGATDPQIYKPLGLSSVAIKFDEKEFASVDSKNVDIVVKAVIDTARAAKIPLYDASI